MRRRQRTKIPCVGQRSLLPRNGHCLPIIGQVLDENKIVCQNQINVLNKETQRKNKGDRSQGFLEDKYDFLIHLFITFQNYLQEPLAFRNSLDNNLQQSRLSPRNRQAIDQNHSSNIWTLIACQSFILFLIVQRLVICYHILESHAFIIFS